MPGGARTNEDIFSNLKKTTFIPGNRWYISNSQPGFIPAPLGQSDSLGSTDFIPFGFFCPGPHLAPFCIIGSEITWVLEKFSELIWLSNQTVGPRAHGIRPLQITFLLSELIYILDQLWYQLAFMHSHNLLGQFSPPSFLTETWKTWETLKTLRNPWIPRKNWKNKFPVSFTESLDQWPLTDFKQSG